MELNKIKKLVKKFKLTKDESVFQELTQHLNLPKCIVTGRHIIYPNTKLRISKVDNTIKLDGTTANTFKTINNKKYTLKVSYEGMVSKFGEEYTSLNTSRIFNRLNKFTKFAFQISDDDYEIAKSTSFGAGVSLDVMIKRYGKVEGTNKFNEYRKKQAYTNTYEYKNEKYGWDKKKFDEFNKSRGVTLKNLIKKHGKEQGLIRFQSYCDRQSETSTYEYLLNKFGKQRADEILDSRGKRIEYFEKVFGDKAIEKYTEYWNNIKNPYYSKISTDLFDLLIIDLKLHDFKIYYKENEYGIYDRQSLKYFKYDFTIPELKIIIEFNGDSWHGNPKIYSENDKPHPIDKEITAMELWKYDEIKKQAAESRGFKLIYVWEDDYRNNFENMYIILKEKINEIRNRRD